MTDERQTASKILTANVKAGGCAAKIGAAELQQILTNLPLTTSPNLLTGMEHFEDAAVYKLSDELAIIQTIDFFPPVVDDPYLYGMIAATNALSDVYAMGGTPLLALNVLCFPTCDFPIEVVRDIVRGGAAQVQAAGAILAGGHSIQSHEPIYGLSVTGIVHPSQVLTNGGAKDGDAIVVCKPIGTGVAFLGMKANIMSKQSDDLLLKSLTTLNKKSLEIALKYSPDAATDVTGFGLIGHVHEMAKASGLSARIMTDKIPFLPEVLELAEQGFVPAGAYGNRKSYEQFTTYIEDVELSITDLLFDPQTSGGLLLAIPFEKSEQLVKELIASDIQASSIGIFKTGKSGFVEVGNNER
ncbi:MAG: selenide, water dikinase SelD [Cyanobacteria bacterium SZAS LIN-5]|nr:selenide, water dikinase SelD [Cyanobacteria bacterium SZAS LIN-5]RTL38480.1 MAG: selenide, water dikinase SelD [Candidatus Melainabacteria bacterium]